VRSLPTPEILKLPKKVKVWLLFNLNNLSSGPLVLTKICPVLLKAIPPMLLRLGVGVVGAITRCTEMLATGVVGSGALNL